MDYIIFRVYSYFKSKENGRDKTIYFLALLACSLLFLLFFLANGLTNFLVTPEDPDPRMKYYIGIPIAIVLFKLTQIAVSKKINNDGLAKLEEKYNGKENLIPIWIIFITPVILILGTPIVYGLINGTLKFPLLDK